MAFPGISKASGHTPAIKCTVQFFSTFRGRGVDPVNPSFRLSKSVVSYGWLGWWTASIESNWRRRPWRHLAPPPENIGRTMALQSAATVLYNNCSHRCQVDTRSQQFTASSRHCMDDRPLTLLIHATVYFIDVFYNYRVGHKILTRRSLIAISSVVTIPLYLHVKIANDQTSV